MRKLNFIERIPSKLEGPNLNRIEPCRICGESTGNHVASVEYWNLSKNQIVKCPKCSLAQLDPMLTETQTSIGCNALYNRSRIRQSVASERRNMFRNFRRGVLFAWSLKRLGKPPKYILELGPGSGYFAQGIKFVFPGAEISVMDINMDVCQFVRSIHGFHTIQSPLGKKSEQLQDKYDLIIARDILEHVIDISKVLKNIKSYLKKGGIFHFITPNGHEDLWQHYLTRTLENKPSELLNNHVNYFEGPGLLSLLENLGFSKIRYYNYQFKTTRRGRGWKKSRNLMAPVSISRSTESFNQSLTTNSTIQDFSHEHVLNSWYVRSPFKKLTYILSWYHHFKILKLNPYYNVGHEIYGLFRIDY